MRAEPQLLALLRLRAALSHVEAEGPWLRALVPETDDAAAARAVSRSLGDIAATSMTIVEPELEDVFVALLGDRAVRPTDAVTAAASPPRRAAATGAPAIEALGLTRDFGRFRAVDGVTFSVRPGEMVVCSAPTAPARRPS